MFEQDIPDYGALVRSGMSTVPDYATQEAQRQQLAIQKQQAGDEHQKFGMQVQAAQREQADEAAFHDDLATIMTNPTPRAVSQLVMKHPKYAEQIKSGWSIQDDAQKQTDLSQLSEIYSAGSGGNYDLAAKVARSRFDADKAAGHADDSEEAIVKALESGDPTQQKAALGMVGVHLAATTGAEHFGSVYGALNKKDDGFTLGAGDARYSADNKMIAHSAFMKGEDGTLYPWNDGTGGGGQVSSGGAPSSGSGAPGRTRFGWTPRSRNGGDNTDAAVDGKIGGMASALGVDPNADISHLSPMRIAQALTISEGGPGSIADRNNNPGNLTDPKTGGYRKFPTKEAGLSAAAAQVARNLKRGQTSIRTMVEGLPVGGSSQQASTDAPSGYHALTPPKAQTHILTTAEVTANRLDPSKVWQRHPDGSTNSIGDAAVDDTPDGDPNASGPAYMASLPKEKQGIVRAIIDGKFPITAKMTSPSVIKLFEDAARVDPTIDATTYQRRVQTQRDFGSAGKSGQAITSARTIINHLYNLATESEKIGGVSWTPLNKAMNWGKGQMSNIDLQGYNATLTPLSNELPKFLGGKAPTIHEIGQTREDFSPDKGPEARRKQIATTMELMQGRFSPLVEAYSQGMNRNADITDLISSVTGDKAAAAKLRALQSYASGGRLEDVGHSRAGPASGAAPSGIPAGSKKLGTYQGKPVYQTPDGRRLVVQ